MGIQKGLKSIQGYREEQDRKREAAAGPKTNWLTIKDKEVVKVRFLQEWSWLLRNRAQQPSGLPQEGALLYGR